MMTFYKKNEKKINVGIIGFGRFAKHYAKLISHNKIKYNNIFC